MAFASKSPWVIHYDGSSCNGCDIEVLAALSPLYDAERFGVVNTGNPKHADILLVTGAVNAQNTEVLREIYDQMIEPKVVVACGICACSGGIFADSRAVDRTFFDTHTPDLWLPGAPTHPMTYIDGMMNLLGRKTRQ